MPVSSAKYSFKEAYTAFAAYASTDTGMLIEKQNNAHLTVFTDSVEVELRKGHVLFHVLFSIHDDAFRVCLAYKLVETDFIQLPTCHDYRMRFYVGPGCFMLMLIGKAQQIVDQFVARLYKAFAGKDAEFRPAARFLPLVHREEDKDDCA